MSTQQGHWYLNDSITVVAMELLVKKIALIYSFPQVNVFH